MNNQSQNAIDLVLAESLKELAGTKPIEKITIKEITDRLELSDLPFTTIFRISMSYLSG